MKEPLNSSPRLPARFLQTCFSPPQLQVSLLSRQRLLDCLDEGLRGRLLLLTAPAGCGKTTVLSQWFHALRRRKVKCAWLSLVRGSSPTELLRLIGWALQLGGVDIHSTGLLYETGEEAADPQDGLAVMLSAVSHTNEPVVLFVDEFDKLRQADSLALVELLIGVCPPNMHVVVACRRRPELSTSVLHAQGMLTSLEAKDLLFSESEAQLLLSQVLRPEDIELIFSKTEGWPVAVSLAKLWFQQGERHSAALAEFRGSITEVSAYLTEQVIVSISTELREFLLDVCILDQISPDMADAVRCRKDSLALVHELSKLQPMATILDPDEPVLRLHPLLADYLVQTLRLRDPTRFVRLQEQAATEYVRVERLMAGVRHAMEADNPNLACTLLVNHAPLRICVMRGSAEVSACLRELPQEVRRLHPRLRLCEIFFLFRRGEHARAQAEFHALKLDCGDRSVEYLLESFVIEALLSMRDSALGARKLEELEVAYITCGKTDPWARLVIDTLALVVHLGAGRLEAARSKLEAQRTAYAGQPLSGAALHTPVHRCHIALVEGHLGDAEAGIRKVLRLARAVIGPDRTVSVIARAVLARIHYESDREELSDTETRALLDDLDKTEAWLDHYAMVYGVAIEIAYRSGGLLGASHLINKGRIAARRQLLGNSFEHLLMTLEADLLTREGNFAAAARWLDSVDKAAPPPTYYERDALAQARARLALARNQPADALEVACNWAETARTEGRAAASCRASLIQSLAFLRLGKHQQCAKVLTQALNWAALESASAPFLEFRTECIELFDALQRAGILSRCAEEDFLGSLRDKLIRGPELRRLHGILTKREVEILDLLRRSASNKHLARAAGITEDAVKFHLKNIYRKLGVHSRSEALAMPDS